MLKEYAKMSEVEDIEKRVSKIEKKNKKWKPHWKQMQKDIDELK
jgi:septation ring formation regulator EzrA